MKIAFLEPVADSEDLAKEKSWAQHFFGEACDILIARIEQDTLKNQQKLAFTLELRNLPDIQLLLWQRILADALVAHLHEGFTRDGANIAFYGEKISSCDFGRGAGFANARLCLYLPSASGSEDANELELTSFRLSGPIDVWAPAVLSYFKAEYEDIMLAVFSLRAAKERMKE